MRKRWKKVAFDLSSQAYPQMPPVSLPAYAQCPLWEWWKSPRRQHRTMTVHRKLGVSAHTREQLIYSLRSTNASPLGHLLCLLSLVAAFCLLLAESSLTYTSLLVILSSSAKLLLRAINWTLCQGWDTVGFIQYLGVSKRLLIFLFSYGTLLSFWSSVPYVSPICPWIQDSPALASQMLN